ncbi:MAG: DUF2851 family protein [Bacteroidales bacterium]|nr:DUF2851 family protein [Bacteroidales bacterium]
MNEDFLQFLWQYRLFNEELLVSDKGEKIKIINIGTKNSDAGPDFFNARIVYNYVEWAGNIEIHKNASDWNKHKHHQDQTYDNVILHIVWNKDTEVYTTQKRQVLTVELPVLNHTKNEYLKLYENHKSIACSDKIKNLNLPITTYLTSLAIARLEKKSSFILFELKDSHYNWEETWYRVLAYSFGLKANAQAFLMLAKSLPLSLIQKNVGNLLTIEALFFGQSGLLPSDSNDPYVNQLIEEYKYQKTKYNLKPLTATIWKFSKIHPPSFPTIRIAQWAAFLNKHANSITHFLKVQSLKNLSKMFNVTPSEYWQIHYHFNSKSNKTKMNLGKSFINIILINSFFPFAFTFSKERLNNELSDWVLDMLEEMPPEKNHIIKDWINAGIEPQNAFQSQALLHLFENYCKPRFCLRCNIGTYILLQTKSLV